MGESKLAVGLSFGAIIIAIIALMLGIMLPGPIGPQGPQGPQGTQGPAWTLSVEKFEWTIAPDTVREATVYLDAGDVLEGSVTDVGDFYTWSLFIWDESNIVRFYYTSDNLDFRYVAETSGNHRLRVYNEDVVTADVLLVYWIIK